MHWQVQEAKAQFSELARHAVEDGAQIVTRHGEPFVVVVSIDEWHRVTGQTMSFRDFLFPDPEDDDRPTVDDESMAELAAIIAARANDLPREIDWED